VLQRSRSWERTTAADRQLLFIDLQPKANPLFTFHTRSVSTSASIRRISVMKNAAISSIALFAGAALTAATAFGQAPAPPYDVSYEVPMKPKALTQPQIPHPAKTDANEEDLEVAQSALESSPGAYRAAAVSAAATGTSLTPPITITYSGSSNAVTINDSGTNRGLSSSLTNTGNSNSAVYGETKGSGAGVKGINSGVNGSAGVFQINNAASTKPAVSATTNGPGSAVVATITKTSSSQPAIMGTSTASNYYGIGVQGTGNDIGVYGLDSSTVGGGYGVYGYSATGNAGVAGLSNSGTGVLAESSTSYGVFGESNSSDGVYGYSNSSSGVYGYSYKADGVTASSTNGRAITAHSVNAIGIYSVSDNGYGVWGQSKNQFGVVGEDSGTGVGVYGSSSSGYAGYFAGKVAATAYLTVSDRNAKTDFEPINSASVLDLVSQLPITSWAFKDDRGIRHIGPMAQDFHSAFGLSGQDDKHINLSDAAGVSLAAIQELNKRLKDKDAQIAALEGKLKSMNDAFSARLAKLEERAVVPPQLMTTNLVSGR
jgi:endosialidase-like protein